MNKHNEWQFFFHDKKILLWGTSIGARQAIQLLDECGLKKNVVAYVDNAKDKWGSYIDGIPVLCPNDLLKFDSLNKKVVVCITSIFWDQIGNQIHQIGVSLPIYIFLWYNPCELKSGCNYVEKEKEEIISFYNIEDSYTLNILDKILDDGLLNTRKFDLLSKYTKWGGGRCLFL